MNSTHITFSLLSFVSWGCADKSSADDICETASASGYRSITKDGVTREYLLDVPESHDGHVWFNDNIEGQRPNEIL